MAPSKLDKIFKQSFEDADKVPSDLDWNKEQAWERFSSSEKQKNVKIRRYIIAASIIIIMLIFSMQDYQQNNLQNKHYAFKEDFAEYHKRQKLRNIELRMSGKTVYEYFCMNCDGFLPQQMNKDSSKQQFVN